LTQIQRSSDCCLIFSLIDFQFLLIEAVKIPITSHIIEPFANEAPGFVATVLDRHHRTTTLLSDTISFFECYLSTFHLFGRTPPLPPLLLSRHLLLVNRPNRRNPPTISFALGDRALHHILFPLSENDSVAWSMKLR